MTCADGDDYLDIEQVRAMLGVGKSRAYTISRDRSFPAPAVVRPKFRLWHRADVEAWMDANRPGWRERG